MTPPLPDLGPWPAGRPALSRPEATTDATPPAESLPGGRRLQVECDADGAVVVRSAGLPLLYAPQVRLGGVGSAVVPLGRAARDEGGWTEEVLDAAGRRGRSRWLPALDLPALAWEVECDAPAFALEWTSPTPGSVDGAVGRWAREDGAPLLLARVDGGRLTTFGASNESARVLRDGPGRVRVLFVAATDDDDLARTVQLVERKQLAGLASARAQHARLLRDYAVSIETPVPGLAASFEAAKRALDASRADVPGLGRGLAAVRGAGWIALPDAAAVAAALLAAGSRDAARDLMQLVATAQERAGRTPAALDAAGRLDLDAPAGAAARAFLALAQRWTAWTGDGALLERLAPALARARREAVSPAMPAAVASVAEPLTEPLPAPTDPALAAAVARLEEELRGRWGVRPDAAAAGVAFHLALPAPWPRAALRRLRVGETVLDLRARRRFGRLLLEVARAHGPALALTVGVEGPAPARLTVDDVELGGTRATFAADGRHEVRFEW